MFNTEKMLFISGLTAALSSICIFIGADISPDIVSGISGFIKDHAFLCMVILAASLMTGSLLYYLIFDKGHSGRAEQTDPESLQELDLPGVDFSHGDLRVSKNGHYIVHQDGTPFFFLGDTAWQLFHKLTREETVNYLENRRARGFTVILASAMPDYYPLDAPNQYGATTLVDNDPEKPNLRPSDLAIDGRAYTFWDHVDWVIDKARELGMYVALLPTWGDKVTKLVGLGPEIFTPENAASYGNWIGKRYAGKDNIIWVIGGDRGSSKPEHRAIWNAMARAIRAVDTRHLMTYHPWTYKPFWYFPKWGGGTSSDWFHNESWLDFNMIQSGHFEFNRTSYRIIERDYALFPVKPTIDGEPNYEGHALQGCALKWLADIDVRKGLYWSMLCGALGHTYGHHAIWQFVMDKYAPTGFPRLPRISWKRAIGSPGAMQCGIARSLFESYEWQKLCPRQEFVLSGTKKGRRHIQAAVAVDGSFALVYIPDSRESVTIDMSMITGEHLTAHWFNPRNARKTLICHFEKAGPWKATSPEAGPDWVLLIERS